MRYIAGRHLNTGERQIAPGEEVPEAAEWTRLDAYVNDGSVVIVLDEPGEHPPVGTNPSDAFDDYDLAMARAVGPRWLGASDTDAVPADAPSLEGGDEPVPDTAPADAPEEEPETPKPVKKAVKKTARPAKRATKKST